MAPSPFYREKLCRLFEKNARDLGLLQNEEKVSEGDVSSHLARGARITFSSTVFLLNTPDEVAPFGHIARLIGREEVSSHLFQKLCAGRGGIITALYGLPGVGKTSLAATFIHREDVRCYFQDGMLWINVGLQPKIEALLSACGGLFGLVGSEAEKSTGVETWTKAIHAAIGKRQMLFVIDNVWSVEDALPFLSMGGPNCAYLVTTRLPNVSLRLANGGAIAVRELVDEESLTLLSRFVPSVLDQEREAARSLVQLVGGLPLELMLVGKYLQMHAYGGQPRRIRAALDRLHDIEERLHLFEQPMPMYYAVGQRRNSSASLRTVIQISDEQLSQPARQALYALAVFPAKPSSFSEEAALAISGASVEVLDTLIDAGLLEGAGSDCYTLHSSIIDYVHSIQVNTDAKTRLVAYTLDYLERYSDAYDVVERESTSIFAGLEAMCEPGQEANLLQAILLFVPFLHLRGLYLLSEKYLLRAHCDAKIFGTARNSISIAYYLGNNKLNQGDYAQAKVLYQQALQLAYQLDEREQCSQLLANLGVVAVELGIYTQADECFQKALVVARQYGYYELIAKLLFYLGVSLAERGNYVQAEAYFQESLTLARRYGYQKWIGVLLVVFGLINGKRGEYTQTDFYFQESLKIAQHLKYSELIGSVLINLGQLEMDRGHYTQAEGYLQDGLTQVRLIGASRLICEALHTSGMLATRRGNYTQALRYLQEGLTLAQRIGHRERQSQLQLSLGVVASAREEYTDAQVYLQESLTLANQLGHSECISGALIHLGSIAVRLKNYIQAEIYLQEGLSLAHLIRKLEYVCLALYVQGESCLEQQDVNGAARCFQEMSLSVPSQCQEQLAYALYGQAQVAHRRGDLAEACKFGEAALSKFDALGHCSMRDVRQWLLLIPLPDGLQKPV